MALSAFVAFSALVGVSVALSNGTTPAPWAPAAAREPSSPDDMQPPVDGRGAQDHPSVFALAPDPAHVPQVRSDVSVEGGAPARDGSGPWIVSVTDLSGGQASSVAPGQQAPTMFEGELPVNTIIAPVQPVTVLDGGQFGWRIAPDNGQRDFHNGTDISVAQGTPVVAALDGTVTAVFWDVWGGNRVEVSHADGLKTTYNHMEHVMVREGDKLRASEQLGTAGQTGLRVTGPHLHFETYVNGQAVDAQSFDWKTGEAIIPASRPQHSLEDQAPVSQPVADAAARPDPPQPVKPQPPAQPVKPSAPPVQPSAPSVKPSAPPAVPQPVQPSAPSVKPSAPPAVPQPVQPSAPSVKPSAPPVKPPAQQPQLNPYTAPISQLATLEQIQQRTQSLLAQQALPTRPLSTDLALLSKQLTNTGLAAQNATFAHQLTVTQEAVERAVAVPTDQKLAAQATKELKALQALVAHIPPFVAAPGGPGTK